MTPGKPEKGCLVGYRGSGVVGVGMSRISNGVLGQWKGGRVWLCVVGGCDVGGLHFERSVGWVYTWRYPLREALWRCRPLLSRPPLLMVATVPGCDTRVGVVLVPAWPPLPSRQYCSRCRRWSAALIVTVLVALLKRRLLL